MANKITSLNQNRCKILKEWISKLEKINLDYPSEYNKNQNTLKKFINKNYDNNEITFKDINEIIKTEYEEFYNLNDYKHWMLHFKIIYNWSVEFLEWNNWYYKKKILESCPKVYSVYTLLDNTINKFKSTFYDYNISLGKPIKISIFKKKDLVIYPLIDIKNTKLFNISNNLKNVDENIALPILELTNVCINIKEKKGNINDINSYIERDFGKNSDSFGETFKYLTKNEIYMMKNAFKFSKQIINQTDKSKAHYIEGNLTTEDIIYHYASYVSFIYKLKDINDTLIKGEK